MECKLNTRTYHQHVFVKKEMVEFADTLEMGTERVWWTEKTYFLFCVVFTTKTKVVAGKMVRAEPPHLK